jgi:hypothetical protein
MFNIFQNILEFHCYYATKKKRMKRERDEKKGRDNQDRRKVKAEGSSDPANGVKFDTVDEKDQVQLATLAFRGGKFAELVTRNSKDSRAKKSASDGVWDEGRKLVSLTKPKGKSFQVFAFLLLFFFFLFFSNKRSWAGLSVT